MKSNRFWVIRWLTVFTGMMLLLVGVGLAKGQAPGSVCADAAFWALLSSTLLIGTRYARARRGIACALCRDTVEKS